MAPLLQELSNLEVESLEIVEQPESEQASRLDTLTATAGDLDVGALLTGKGAFPVNMDCCCCVLCCGCC